MRYLCFVGADLSLLAAMSFLPNPGVAEIMSVSALGPPYGAAAGPTGGFGGNPNVPYVTWEPRGADVNQTQPAGFLRNGLAPRSTAHIELKGVDFIQQQFNVPPWTDESDRYIMPEMLCFSVNEMDPDENATSILTLPKLNQLLHDAHREFRQAAAAGSPDYSPAAAAFLAQLETFGEGALELYAKARRYKHIDDQLRADLPAGRYAQLQAFFLASTEDLLCWQTRYGILNKVSYLGSVINVNRATSVEEEDMSQFHQRYSQVNVCMAKRARVANVFGPANRITTGSKLWLNLRRVRVPRPDGNVTYGAYQVVPGGCTMRDRPAWCPYEDPSGRPLDGHVWHVGVVIVPGPRSPSQSETESASNTGVYVSERRAYEDHGLLPSLYVALGFKH
jgi:hypothetical protein